MNRSISKTVLLVAAAGLAASLAAPALAQSAINYQGELTDSGGSPITVATDVRLTLWTAATGGTQSGAAANATVTPVNGLFSIDADFGVGPFVTSGTARFLQVEAKPAGGGSFQVVGSRKLLTATNYSLSTRGVNVDSTGKVGLGGATPLATLHVSAGSVASIAPDANSVAVLEKNTNAYFSMMTPAGNEKGILFGEPGATAANYADGAIIYNSANAMLFRTNGNVERMRLDASGNLGLGTNSPSNKFHVDSGTNNQTALFTSNSSIGTWLRLPNTTIGGLDWGFISTGNGNGEGAGKFLIRDNTNSTARMTFDSGGNVGIGTSSPAAKLHVVGTIRGSVLELTGGSDVAEPFNIAAAAGVEAQPGMVVTIDPERVGELKVSTKAYDRAVAGVMSGANGVNPGIVLTQRGSIADGKMPVAMSGRVWVYADADAGTIEAGDLLTTSDTPGHAMKASDSAKAGGATIGKAMSNLKSGKGLVLVLTNLQ